MTPHYRNIEELLETDQVMHLKNIHLGRFPSEQKLAANRNNPEWWAATIRRSIKDLRQFMLAAEGIYGEDSIVTGSALNTKTGRATPVASTVGVYVTMEAVERYVQDMDLAEHDLEQ